MRKLIFILLAFLAVFTYIRAFDKVEAGEMPPESPISGVKTAHAVTPGDINIPPILQWKKSVEE